MIRRFDASLRAPPALEAEAGARGPSARYRWACYDPKALARLFVSIGLLLAAISGCEAGETLPDRTADAMTDAGQDAGEDAPADASADAAAPDAPAPDVAEEGGVDAAAGDAEATDAGPPIEICRLDDGDVATPLPIADETLLCAPMADAPGPLFPDVAPLPAEYAQLHSLCGLMDPTPVTLDHVANATLSRAIDELLTAVMERPALRRVLASVGTSTAAQLAALKRVWLDQNALEHVLCGDHNVNGTVGGLHLWSEFYFAEQEGRANYLCTVEGLDDPDVATIRFTWIPPGAKEPSFKPIGGFHAGMSPACLLAIGYHAVETGVIPLPGSAPAFQVTAYDQPVSFAIGIRDGGIITLFPVADPR